MIIQMTPNAIGKETAKAILVNGVGWLPKSQTHWLQKDGMTYLYVPGWLAFKKQISKWTNTGTQIAWKYDLEEALNEGATIIDSKVYS